MTARSGGPAPRMHPSAGAPHARASPAPANPYDRSRGFAPHSLPTPPPAVRCRSDAMRDYDRLTSTFKELLAMPPPASSPQPTPPGGSPPRTPRPEFDAFDDAIAAANAMSNTLCEWRLAIAAGAPATPGAG